MVFSKLDNIGRQSYVSRIWFEFGIIFFSNDAQQTGQH